MPIEKALLFEESHLSVASEHFVIVQPIHHEVASVFMHGASKHLVLPHTTRAFYESGRKVKIVKVDLRPTPLEVTAQEVLTKDGEGIRVTLTAFYKVIDALKATTGSADLSKTQYRLVQFAIREAVATRTLDEILGPVQLGHVSAGAEESEISLANGRNLFHSRQNLDQDGLNHFVAEVDTVDASIRVCFEDLWNGGDSDSDDSVFLVRVGQTNSRLADRSDTGNGNDDGSDYIDGGNCNDQLMGMANNGAVEMSVIT